MTGKQFNQALMHRFEIEIKKNDHGGIYGYTQRLLAYNSNKIEGSTLTEAHTASLFETGTISANGEIFLSKDIEEANGHFLMFRHMIKTAYEPLSEDLIKQYHYYLKIGVFEDRANGYPVGEYKNRRNMFSNIETTLPLDVPEAIQKMLMRYHEKDHHSIQNLAQLYADFEKIHPFQDGNGRTGRIILFKECIQNNLVPFIIQDKNKATYHHVLNKAQTTGDVQDLAAFFAQEQEVYYEVAKDFIVPQMPKKNHNYEEEMER